MTNPSFSCARIWVNHRFVRASGSHSKQLWPPPSTYYFPGFDSSHQLGYTVHIVPLLRWFSCLLDTCLCESDVKLSHPLRQLGGPVIESWLAVLKVLGLNLGCKVKKFQNWLSQGSQKPLEMKFHDFSMTFHDQISDFPWPFPWSRFSQFFTENSFLKNFRNPHICDYILNAN